jgi:WD40 repeat protein/serine/threonine protein kinase
MGVDAGRAKYIFLEALDRPSQELRSAFLDEACVGDSELRRRVQRLLDAHDGPDRMLDRPAAAQFLKSTDGSNDATPLHGTGDVRPCEGADKAAADPTSEAMALLEPAGIPESLGRLGHYEVLAVLGVGGFGTVFKGFDQKLHRIVAIKMLAPLLASSASARQRFLREARAAAAVRDEHVIDIHAVEEKPIPYLVMEYIDGLTLQQKLERTGPLPVKEILRIGYQIAAGLAGAHKQGLIHRDIKPANILLENGVERVKISDFGLARLVDDASVTQSGLVAGTPMYMSPEQAEAHHVDHRSDLFSLGSVLYALCTGHPPFRAGSPMAVLMRVCDDTPRPVGEVNPDIPDWLVQVVTRLLAKKPADRFQSARELADLLATYLAHLQVHGQVLSTNSQTPFTGSVHEKTGVKASVASTSQAPLRRPALSARRLTYLTAGVLAIAVASWLLYPYLHRPIGTDTPIDHGKLDNVTARPPNPLDRRARIQIPTHLLALAGGGDPERAPPEAVAVLADGRLRHESLVDGMVFVNQGSVLISAEWSGALSWWDAATGELLRRVPHAHNGWIRGLVLTRDGTELLTGGRDGTEDMPGTIRFWDVRTGELRRTLPMPFKVLSLAASADGRWLAAGSDEDAEHRLAILDAATGQVQHTITASTHQWIQQLAFSPSSKLLAVAGHDATLRLFDPESGQEVRSWNHGFPIDLVAFHPGGSILATAGLESNTVRFWNPADGTMLHPFTGHRKGIQGLAFSPDGKSFATADEAGEVRIWDVTSRSQRHRLVGHKGRNWPAFSPDSRTLAAVGANLVVRLWAVQSGQERLPYQGWNGAVHATAFSPDGTLLAMGGDDKAVRICDLAGWKEGELLPPVHRLTGHAQRVGSVQFSPDGELLASGSLDRTIILWKARTGEHVRTLRGHAKNDSYIAFSPDGRTIAAGGDDGEVRFWDVASGNPRPSLSGHTGPVRCVAYSPDGKLLASCGVDRIIHVYDTKTDQVVQDYPLAEIVERVAFSPDGQWLGATTENANPSALHFWRVGSWRQTSYASHFANVSGLTFSPTAPLAVTSAADGTLRFWDLLDETARTPRHVTIGPGPFGKEASDAAFTPDGRYVATANQSGTVTILKASPPPERYEPGAPAKLASAAELASRPSGADTLDPNAIPAALLAQAGGGDPAKAPPGLAAILGGADAHANQVRGVVITPNGKLLATCGKDKNVHVWDLVTGKRLHCLTDHKESVYSIAVSSDNHTLATTADDGTVRLWDAEAGKLLHTLAAPFWSVLHAAFSPDGQTIAAATASGIVTCWDVKTGRPGRTFSMTGGPCWSVAFSQDGRTLATGHQDGMVRLWDVGTGWLLARVGPNPAAIRHVRFHPDGQTLVSCSGPEILLWDLTTLKEKQRLTGLNSVALSCAVRPDGGLVAAAGETDGTLQLWDLTTDPVRHREVPLFAPGTRYLHGVALTPEGRYLATANPDGTVYILRVHALTENGNTIPGGK